MADIPAYTEKLLAQLMADRRNLLVHSSDQLSSGFPSPDQLAGAIAFAPTQGNIWLFGRRYLLMQGAAFGELRRELIRGLGMEKARGIYTSTGWHAGARLARQVAQQWPAGDHGSLYSAGPRLHMLEGMVNVEPIHFAIDSGAGSFYSDMFWHNSLEAQEHLAHHGTAGDPDYATALTILRGLPEAGADVIEMGMPFTDPMADGPAIQLANQRALGNGMSLRKTLQMVSEFRQDNDYTPIVLMGYYNPIFHYGVDNFIRDAKQAGVDGLIVVDVPAEHNEELCEPAQAAGIDFIRLTTPTTDDVRLPTVLKDSSGFIYYVSVAGVTGGATASLDQVSEAVARLRRHSDLPVCIGFGIRTAEHAANVARLADGVVVGSALVDKINAAQTPEQAIIDVLAQCREISQGVHGARE